MANTPAILGQAILGRTILGVTDVGDKLAAPVISLVDDSWTQLSAPVIYLSDGTESGGDSGDDENTGGNAGGSVILKGPIIAWGQITLCCLADIVATHRYYRLVLSTAAKPARPTAYPPASPWTEIEPDYTEGSTNNLYTVDCTIYGDGSFSYSEVSLSSSYEAAKQAYNKAVSAGNTASDAKDTADAAATMVSTLTSKVTGLDGRVTTSETRLLQTEKQLSLTATKEEVESIRVGGRNLIRNSADMIYKDYYFGDEPVEVDPEPDEPKLTAPVIYLTAGQLDAPVITIEEV